MNADQQILTQLANEYREVAFAPVNEERRALWLSLIHIWTEAIMSTKQTPGALRGNRAFLP